MKSSNLIHPAAGLLLLTSTLGASAGLSLGNYSVTPNVWAGAPTLYNTAVPNTDSTVSNGGAGNAIALTFTTGISGFTLDKFAIVAGGGPSQGLLNLYPNPVGGTEADGFVNLGFSTSLLNGGVSIPFTFSGTADETILEFDLTGLDEITLAANTKYALDFKPDPAGSGFNFFVRRGGAFYTGGGNIYVGAATGSERFDVAGGRRDAPLALYAVPEPTSAALIGMGGLLVWNQIRRRAKA